MFEVIYGILARLDLVFKAFGYVRDDGEGEEPELSEDIPNLENQNSANFLALISKIRIPQIFWHKSPIRTLYEKSQKKNLSIFHFHFSFDFCCLDHS